jgi:hypothetical protein
MTDNTTQIPVGCTIDVQPGPDGKQAVVLMLQCGSVTAAMALPPDVADEWAAALPRLMFEAAREARKKDRLPQRDSVNGGLLKADASALVHLNRASRRRS